MIGSVAIGWVCGWWSAPLFHAHAAWRTWVALAGAVTVLALEARLLAGERAPPFLMLGYAIGLSVHTTVRAALAARVARKSSEEAV